MRRMMQAETPIASEIFMDELKAWNLYISEPRASFNFELFFFFTAKILSFDSRKLYRQLYSHNI